MFNFDYTFSCCVSSKSAGFYWYKTNDIIALNLWFVNFFLYKGDIITDFDKFQSTVKKETKREDLSFANLILKRKKR